MQLINQPAFLLTRQWRDTPDGIALEFWVRTESQVLRLVIPDQQAVCFIERHCDIDSGNIPFQRKPLALCLSSRSSRWTGSTCGSSGS